MLGLFLTGCHTVPVKVTNPIPGLTTVAVAPFINLSPEPTADGRRFALAYYAELQKIPGFQVIPVGVVEHTLEDYKLTLDSRADALRLAEILDVDAVVVGAITEYSPYYPPQIGLQIDWFSPREWLFFPGIPLGDPSVNAPPPGVFPPQAGAPTAIMRGQSPNDPESAGGQGSPFLEPLPSAQSSGRGTSTARPVEPRIWPHRVRGRENGRAQPVRNTRQTSSAQPHIASDCPIKPLMSYTRFFDGADPKLVKSLQDYVAYRGDMRSGGWEAYLHRSDDFLSFTSHMMIVEMLALHGGAVETETAYKVWKFWK